MWLYSSASFNLSNCWTLAILCLSPFIVGFVFVSHLFSFFDLFIYSFFFLQSLSPCFSKFILPLHKVYLQLHGWHPFLLNNDLVTCFDFPKYLDTSSLHNFFLGSSSNILLYFRFSICWLKNFSNNFTSSSTSAFISTIN